MSFDIIFTQKLNNYKYTLSLKSENYGNFKFKSEFCKKRKTYC